MKRNDKNKIQKEEEIFTEIENGYKENSNKITNIAIITVLGIIVIFVILLFLIK